MNANTPSCTEFEGLLPLYVGGDLEPAQSRSVAGHVRACARCAARAARARAARIVYRSAAVTDEPPELWEGIRAALVAGGLVHAPRSRVAARGPVPVLTRNGLAWGGLVSAAAALLVGVLWITSGPEGTGAGLDQPGLLDAPLALEGASAAPDALAGVETLRAVPAALAGPGALRRAGTDDARLADEARWQVVPFLLVPMTGPQAAPLVQTASDRFPALR